MLALSKCAKTVERDGKASLALDLGLRARGLAKMLCEKRSYFKRSVAASRIQQQKQDSVNELDPFAETPVTPSPTYLTYDPRLLMFEFSLAIILRQRQVQLTKQFVQSAEKGGGESFWQSMALMILSTIFVSFRDAQGWLDLPAVHLLSQDMWSMFSSV